eukprot:TRINITY_DN846_c0_g1_i1.p2 TRINITY_DN846_c0_g1~~TRINITY_DN846_c0_g1_i1.p2  ORF type:complete len:108 (-),score=3.71 TRINITY_DN846_c0_g1_i1:104-427(-)
MFSWFRSSKENETTPMDVCVDDVPPLNEGGSLDCVDIGNHLPSNRRSRDVSFVMDTCSMTLRCTHFCLSLCTLTLFSHLLLCILFCVECALGLPIPPGHKTKLTGRV